MPEKQIVTPLDSEVVIPLTNDQVAIVDLEDRDRIGAHLWYARWCKDTRSFYAVRNVIVEIGKRGTVLMHREVMGLQIGSGGEVDHINGNTLDNRRSNLRLVTRSQNRSNSRLAKNNVTGAKNVHWRADQDRYVVIARRNGKAIYLGSSKDLQVAIQIRDEMVPKIHGEFARLS